MNNVNKAIVLILVGSGVGIIIYGILTSSGTL